MHITVVSGADLPAKLAADWRALQATAPRLQSPFLSPDWTAAVARAQGPADEVKVVVIRNPDGALLGVFPARVRQGRAMPVGAPMCDYQGLVARSGVEIDPSALLRALSAVRYDFSHMLAEDLSFGGHGQGATPSWIVEVDQDYDAYEAERRAAGVGLLKDLDKKRRKITREIGAPRFTALSSDRDDFNTLMGWKQAQLLASGQPDLFKAPWVSRLLEGLLERRDPDFGGGLYTLHVGQDLIAAHFHLRGPGLIHGWLIGHDARFERYSPGLLLFQDLLRAMGKDGHRRLDLGPGDYRFKREMANARQDVMHGFVGLPSGASLMRGMAYGLRNLAEAMPLGAASALPGKAMRRLDVVRGLH